MSGFVFSIGTASWAYTFCIECDEGASQATGNTQASQAFKPSQDTIGSLPLAGFGIPIVTASWAYTMGIGFQQGGPDIQQDPASQLDSRNPDPDPDKLNFPLKFRF